MPLFALPISTASSAPQSRVRFSSLPFRNKRKRDASPTASLSDDDNDDPKSQYSRSETAASTNPLSLTPAEVVQYRLAGLELDEEIPSVKGWPHRGLTVEPRDIFGRKDQGEGGDKGKRKVKTPKNYSEDEGDQEYREPAVLEGLEEQKVIGRGPMLRLQHISVLTAILQRSLLEGEIRRASRAWAMLIRAQVGGKGMDLRGSGYWAIGAELLIRNGATPRGKPRSRNSADIQDDGDEEQDGSEAGKRRNRKKRHGSAEGMAKAKEYYERLILQHPYKRQFQGSVSALDFWPAMIGCEIYGIQHEQKESLKKLALAEENEDDEAVGTQSDSGLEPGEEGENTYAHEQRRKARRHQNSAEKRWYVRDKIRTMALVAYEQIASRLDDLMTTPPYSDSHVLLRLRAMLALCIGDHMVPALPSDVEAGKEDEETLERTRRLGIGGKDTEHRFLTRKRIADHERGKKKQREEHIRARKLFKRIERESGRKEGVTDSLPGDEDAEESFDAD